MRISSEKYEFWEEKYFWLFILLIIILIILIVIIVLLSIKIYTNVKKVKNQNKKQAKLVNTERPSQNYISEYNQKTTKIKKLKHKTRVIEDPDE